MTKGQMTIKQLAHGKHSRRIYAQTAQGVWVFNHVPRTEQQLHLNRRNAMFEKITRKLEAAKTTISTKPLAFEEGVKRAESTYEEYVAYMREKYSEPALNRGEAEPTDRVLCSIMAKMNDKAVHCEDTYTRYLTANGNVARSLLFVRCHRRLDELNKLCNTANYLLTCVKNNQPEETA